MRRLLIIVGMLVVIGIVVIGIAQSTNPAAQPIDTADSVTVERKQIVASVSASGSVSPVADLSLNFDVPGTVQEITVVEGQVVRKGDVLARLNSDELELALKQAEQTLLIQQIAYSQTLSPSEADVAAAQAQLDSAQANLRALSQPDELQVGIAERQAQVSDETRRQVELQWDQVKDQPLGGLPRDTLQSQYAQAVLQAQIAQLQFEIVKRGGTSDQLAAARAQMAQAQAAVNRLQPDGNTLQLAEAQLRQAEINVELARLRLSKAILSAPFDATVALINIVEGQVTGASALPAMVLADLTSFHIDVGVDEIDIGRLSEGQLAQIELDALPGQIITGVVEHIAPIARETAGVVSYIVTITIDPSDAPIRAGMNAVVDVITEVRDGVLVIPNRFIRIDRSTGRTYVDVQRGDQAEEVEIITGLRNDSESEVLQGLSEGDVVLILNEGLQLPFGG